MSPIRPHRSLSKKFVAGNMLCANSIVTLSRGPMVAEEQLTAA